jgi:predicted amidohydrolase
MLKRKGIMIFLILFFVLFLFTAFLFLARKNGWLYDESHIARHLKIASVSMEADVDPAVNRQKMAALVQAIIQEHPNVELILFGEAILGWYSKGEDTAQYQRSIAESIPGETTTRMSALAVENGIYLSFGMTELSDGKLYNSQVLIDPAGEVIAVHRKVNLQGSSVFQPGDVPATMAEIKGIPTAIIICSDIQSGDVRAQLKAQNPELILGSLANPSDPNWFVAGMTARMFDAWIVTANRYGQDARYTYDGQMSIGDPLGELRVKSKDREQVVYYDIGFAEESSALVKGLRRIYVGVSLAAHFVRNIGMMFSR